MIANNIHIITEQFIKIFPMDHLPHVKYTNTPNVYILAYFTNKESGSERLNSLSKVTHLQKTGSKSRTQLFKVYSSIVPTMLEQGKFAGQNSEGNKHSLHSLGLKFSHFLQPALHNPLRRFLHEFLWLKQYTLRMVLLNGQLRCRIAFL